ncbi:quinolinate synthase A [Desulfosarcina ovata subsp. sediminis]|uniref:Quinolinate synthase n=1 Tax=Desulfosarcina ovata subsp. sediminis TaxID=885957 RepID=A0A5K7ZS80_9BACT|nr:quinolinate synthase NadA [Desulfosarcina ovata]BBO83062.1 quinolinate synthase A [Desulfosarcina ovata subsp. sediminis]
MQTKIRKLLKEKNAVLLAHNYEPPEIQALADMCGDSLELSIRAADTDADVIVFCGVHFMAETASILSPQKTVLLPRADAGCPMADMITPMALKARLSSMPAMPVVTYVNSSAAVKALSTICCTSANAIEVVRSLTEDELLMTPDRNLAQNTARHTDKTIHLWEGCCPIHDRLSVADVEAARKAHPGALFIAHPECRPEVVALADAALSTSGMMRFAAESEASEFIVGTEVGLLHPLAQKNPGKSFYPASETMICPDMKKITPRDILTCLETMSGQIKVPEEIRVPALAAVERMIALSR